MPVKHAVSVSWLCDEVAHDKLTVRFPWVEFDANTRRVTVAFARMARFDRGGRGSMYAEREYERVQFVGFIVEVAIKPPQPSPPFASAEKGIPMSESVVVQLPTTGRMLGTGE